MNTVVTSKEDILKTSRELIQQQGWSALNIRSVAAACGVSVGAIYNYFDSKAALVGAAVESIWHEIFHRPGDRDVFQDTQDCIVWMYEQMEYGCTLWDLCSRIKQMENGECSRPGGISWMNCVPF